MARDKVTYEWTIEELDEHGDIVNSDFCKDNPKHFIKDFLENKFLEEDVIDIHFGLVRYVGNEDDGLSDKSWAYFHKNDRGELFMPTHFHDAFMRPCEKIPARFFAQVVKAQEELLNGQYR